MGDSIGSARTPPGGDSENKGQFNPGHKVGGFFFFFGTNGCAELGGERTEVGRGRGRGVWTGPRAHVSVCPAAEWALDVPRIPVIHIWATL